MVRALDTSFLFDVLRGLRGAAATAVALDAEGELLTVPAPVLAEFLDGAYLVGGVHLTEATPLLAGRDVVPFDRSAASSPAS